MSTHAMGTFEFESWQEEPYDEQEGASLEVDPHAPDQDLPTAT